MNLYKFIKNSSHGGIKFHPVSYKGKSPVLKGWPQTSSNNSKQIEEWFKDKQMNAGIPTGNINGFFVIDIDKKSGGFESLNVLNERYGDLVNLCRYVVDTGGGGLHLYFKLKDDQIIRNSASKIFAGVDIRAEGGQVVSPFSTHENGNIYLPRIEHEDKTLYIDDLNYAPEELINLLLDSERTQTMSHISVCRHVADDIKFLKGERNDGLFRLACKLKNGPIASFEGFRAMLGVENKRLCQPPLGEVEVDQISKSAFYRYKDLNKIDPIFDEGQYYGIFGRIVNLIKNETEASPEALYSQFLIIFGNLIERKFFYSLSGSSLFTNEFGLIIGKTSKARKGTSFRACSYFFKKAWGDKFNNRLYRGLSSGEGVVWALRDPVSIEKLNKKGESKIEILDIGNKDKNAIFLEEEFSKPIKNTKRETNNLSEVIRLAYDCETLQSLSKSQPAKVTDPNISIIGHTTKEEFIKTLNSVERDNGMLNRMLFIYSYRKNIISRPTSFDKLSGVNEIIRDLLLLKSFIDSSENVEVEFSNEAQKWWDRFYFQYANADDSINENVKGRTEVHILKIAMILAVSDTKSKIDVCHLESAKALVEYSNQTIDYVFNNQKENKNDRLINFIKTKGNSCNRTAISHEYFNKKKKSFEINQIRDQLIQEQLITISHNSNSEIWSLATWRHGEDSDMINVDSKFLT